MTTEKLQAEIDSIDRQLEAHRQAAQELEERREALQGQLKLIKIKKGFK